MPALLFEKQGNIALITLNRPEVRNAVNPELAIRLCDAWDEVRNDPEIRCAVVTGAGDAFCAGADLKLLIPLITGARKPEDEWDEKLVARPQAGGEAWLRDNDPEKPIVAAINGVCIAGGLELTCSTDIRVAADDAIFALQEAKWGLFPLAASTIHLPWTVPFRARWRSPLLRGSSARPKPTSGVCSTKSYRAAKCSPKQCATRK